MIALHKKSNTSVHKSRKGPSMLQINSHGGTGPITYHTLHQECPIPNAITRYSILVPQIQYTHLPTTQHVRLMSFEAYYTGPDLKSDPWLSWIWVQSLIRQTMRGRTYALRFSSKGKVAWTVRHQKSIRKSRLCLLSSNRVCTEHDRGSCGNMGI